MVKITHTYNQTLAGNQTRTGRIDGVKSYKQATYAFGDKPANHPVPAVIYDVDIGQIWRDTVSTLRVDDNVIVYEYYNKDATR